MSLEKYKMFSLKDKLAAQEEEEKKAARKIEEKKVKPTKKAQKALGKIKGRSR